MAKTVYTLNFTQTKAAPPVTAAEFERNFETLEAALDFCVELTRLGGEALYLVKYVYGTAATVLEGGDLALAIMTHRPGRDAA